MLSTATSQDWSVQSEVCHMIVECCAQERSYIKFFGLLAQRFCQVNRDFQDCFVDSFAEQVGYTVARP